MIKFLIELYNFLPIKLRNRLGRSSFLKSFRDALLRPKGVYREAKVLVKRVYLDYNVEFIFFASIKTASTALKNGIESTLLRNSIRLLKDAGKTSDDSTIIDIGSNFGYLSLVWSKTVATKGNVIAFEPNKNVYNSFSKSIAINNLQKRMQLYNLAVGREDKSIELYINSTTSNILKNSNWDQNEKECTLIEMVSLDNFMKKNSINHCDLIKIDVDGIELDILEGAREVISIYKPVFIVETNGNNEIINFFNEYSYKILDMKLNEYQEDAELPVNVFCIPKTN